MESQPEEENLVDKSAKLHESMSANMSEISNRLIKIQNDSFCRRESDLQSSMQDNSFSQSSSYRKNLGLSDRNNQSARNNDPPIADQSIQEESNEESKSSKCQDDQEIEEIRQDNINNEDGQINQDYLRIEEEALPEQVMHNSQPIEYVDTDKNADSNLKVLTVKRFQSNNDGS